MDLRVDPLRARVLDRVVATRQLAWGGLALQVALSTSWNEILSEVISPIFAEQPPPTAPAAGTANGSATGTAAPGLTGFVGISLSWGTVRRIRLDLRVRMGQRGGVMNLGSAAHLICHEPVRVVSLFSEKLCAALLITPHPLLPATIHSDSPLPSFALRAQMVRLALPPGRSVDVVLTDLGTTRGPYRWTLEGGVSVNSSVYTLRVAPSGNVTELGFGDFHTRSLDRWRTAFTVQFTSADIRVEVFPRDEFVQDFFKLNRAGASAGSASSAFLPRLVVPSLATRCICGHFAVHTSLPSLPSPCSP